MTAQQAAQAFQKRQAATLKRAYQQAYKTGQRNYRSQYATPPVQPAVTATASLPATAPATAMSRALYPALTSLAAMTAAIALIVPAAGAGSIAAGTALAVGEYLESQAWRLAGALSIVWAAEQAGYAFAAHNDGLLLDWQLDPSPLVDHCDTCPLLAALPPMPLAMWPTFPGEGLTDCRQGCKCSFHAIPGRVPRLDQDQEQLVARIANRQPVLVAA